MSDRYTKANALFLHAILKNSESRRMLHKFREEYAGSALAGLSGAEERLHEEVRAAVLQGFFELRDKDPRVAEDIARADIETKIEKMIVLSKGRADVLDKLIQMSLGMTRHILD